MQKKAQVGVQIGSILVMFIAVLVGLIFFQAIAQQAGSSTTTSALDNLSIGTVDNVTTYYIDYRSINTGGADFHIINGTAATGNRVNAANYTVVNNVIDPSDGTLSVSITPLSTVDYVGEVWLVSGTAQPRTYVADSGARAVVGLIAIFFALAVIVIALEPTLRNGVLSGFK